jgi:hypothetical protein
MPVAEAAALVKLGRSGRLADAETRVGCAGCLADPTISGSQTGSQCQQGLGVVMRRQAIVVAGQRDVGPRWASPGLVRFAS